MNKILFLFLSLSLVSPLCSQTKKPVKKSTTVKTTKTTTKAGTKTSANKPITSTKKINPAPANKTVRKTTKSVDKKTTGTVAKKTSVPQKKTVGNKKSTIPVAKKTTTTTNLKSDCIKYSVSKKVKNVLKEAKAYEGVPYKLGGNTKKGIDCSALVKASFKEANVELPRRSIEMSDKGNRVKVNKIKEGDLLFFATSKGKINHVAIVYKIKEGGIISFIHASSSRGVMISDLEGSYWPERFVKAKRII